MRSAAARTSGLFEVTLEQLDHLAAVLTAHASWKGEQKQPVDPATQSVPHPFLVRSFLARASVTTASSRFASATATCSPNAVNPK